MYILPPILGDGGRKEVGVSVYRTFHLGAAEREKSEGVCLSFVCLPLLLRTWGVLEPE